MLLQANLIITKSGGLFSRPAEFGYCPEICERGCSDGEWNKNKAIITILRVFLMSYSLNILAYYKEGTLSEYLLNECGWESIDKPPVYTKEEAITVAEKQCGHIMRNVVEVLPLQLLIPCNGKDYT